MADPVPSLDELVEVGRAACTGYIRAEAVRAILTAVLPRVVGAAANEMATLCMAYVNLLEAGRDRIIGLGGDCDPVEVMEAGDPSLRRARTVSDQIRALGGG